MILLCGISSEAPLALVASALDDLGEPYLVFNQRRFEEASLDYCIHAGRVTGCFRIDGQEYPLESIRGVYNRLMDDQSLPEVQELPAEHPLRLRCRRLHDALLNWIEVSPARVINRMAAMASNASKPYQMQLIRQHGFAIPTTLITNDPEAVRQFFVQHRQVIYKSASGVRSIVASLQPEDFARLERIRWCPTQFQVQIVGENLRIHVIGDRVFATLIRSGAVDYRYASRQGKDVELQAVEVADDLVQRCVSLARGLGLAFAGIDLMLADDAVYCFEVNPNPGFSYYEAHTEQPIAEAIARYLIGQAA